MWVEVGVRPFSSVVTKSVASVAGTIEGGGGDDRLGLADVDGAGGVADEAVLVSRLVVGRGSSGVLPPEPERLLLLPD
jgi:hypothetical protein